MLKKPKPKKRRQRLTSLSQLPDSKRRNEKASETVTVVERSGKTETVTAKKIVNGTVTEIAMNEHATKKGVIVTAREMTGTDRIASVEVMTRSVNIANESRRNTKNLNAMWSPCGAKSKNLPRLVSETRLSDSNVTCTRKCGHFEIAIQSHANAMKCTSGWSTFITPLSSFMKPPGIFTKPVFMKLLRKLLSTPKRLLVTPETS